MYLIGMAKSNKGLAAWHKCKLCEDYFCRVHKKHVYDCSCKGFQEWDIDPRDPGTYKVLREEFGLSQDNEE